MCIRDRVVVADSRFARDGRFIEKVGFFNPLLPKEKKERVGLEAERIKYWLGQGAKPTTRVARILGENELMPMPANGNNPIKAVPKKERNKKEEEIKKLQKQTQLLMKKLQKQKLQQRKKNNLKIIYVASSSVYTLSRDFSRSFIQRTLWKSFIK